MDLRNHIILAMIVLTFCGIHVQGRFSINKNTSGYRDKVRLQAGVVENILSAIQAKQAQRKAETTLLTQQCEEDLQKFNDAMALGKSWADAMYNSWGVPNSQFYEGDNLWEGNYDTCAEYKEIWEISGEQGVPARFCVMDWWSVVYAPVPSVDGIGLCLPQSCTQADFIEYLSIGALNGSITVPLGYPYQNPTSMDAYCVQTEEEQHEQLRNDPSAMACFSVIGLFVLFACVGTIYDIVGMFRSDACERRALTSTNSGKVNGGFAPGETKDDDSSSPSTNHYTNEFLSKPDSKWEPSTFGRVLMSFSIRKNAAGIMNFKQSKGSIECLNGIRFLTFAWILVGHAHQQGVYIGQNRPNLGAKFRMASILTKASYQTINQMPLSVESFFILSAMLTTISFLKKLEKQKPDCQMMGLYYFHRFWRLTPVYMFVIMFMACMYQYLWRGPFYLNHPDADACKSGWWQNLLYLNNLLRTDDGMCIGWTWYLANDFQFYVFAPAILFPLFYLAPLGISLGVLCGIGGLITRGVQYHKWFVEGEATEDFWVIYVKPWSRCTTYFMGMMFGYLMYKIKFKTRLHPGLIVLGWILGLGAVSVSVFLRQTGGDWPTEQAHVAWETLQRPLFTCGVCWIIFACSTGNGGVINNILSWDGWLPWARLSYVGYLIHPIIIFWHAFISPHQIYPTNWQLILWALGMLMLVMGASLVVSVLFEMPFAALEKVMFANIPKPQQRTVVAPVELKGLDEVEGGTPKLN